MGGSASGRSFSSGLHKVLRVDQPTSRGQRLRRSCRPNEPSYDDHGSRLCGDRHRSDCFWCDVRIASSHPGCRYFQCGRFCRASFATWLSTEGCLALPAWFRAGLVFSVRRHVHRDNALFLFYTHAITLMMTQAAPQKPNRAALDLFLAAHL